MGLILDTSIFIAGERRGEDLDRILERVQNAHGIADQAIAAISVIELDHGIYRARNEASRTRRRTFVDDICRDVPVYPLSLSIARLAGRIEGELAAASGTTIALADLIIGATALHLSDAVVTLNTRHFRMIPGLAVLTL